MVPMFAGEPMDRIAIDLLSGLPKTKAGNSHILVCCDYLTKWTEAWPVTGESAVICAKTLVKNWFVRYGIPLQLHSDAAKAFTGTLFTELSRLCDMEKTKTSGYHPQGDGLVERANRTIISMLRTVVKDHQNQWDEHLPFVLAAYRASKHASTGVSPNYLMFGREVHTPVTLMLPPPTERPFTDEWVQNLQEHFHYAHSIARQEIGISAQTQKSYHDRRVRSRGLWVGQEVWVYWPRKTKSGKTRKLTPCWDGPWTILRFVTEVNVEVQKGRTKAILHVDRVRPKNVYETRPDTTEAGQPEQDDAPSTGEDTPMPGASIPMPRASPQMTGSSSQMREQGSEEEDSQSDAEDSENSDIELSQSHHGELEAASEDDDEPVIPRWLGTSTDNQQTATRGDSAPSTSGMTSKRFRKPPQRWMYSTQ